MRRRGLLKLFVSEYLCSGAWPGELAGSKLLAEGLSMFLALLEDIIQIPDVQVETTWDVRLGDFPLNDVSVCRPGNVIEEEIHFRRLATECDATYVIAPELDGILALRRELVDTVEGTFVGPSLEAIRLCSDKLAMAEHLGRSAIPTIETRLLELENLAPAFDFPLVVKPRDGAGCESTYYIKNIAEFEETCSKMSSESLANQQWIQQRFLQGTALSMAIMAGGTEGQCDLFPVCAQGISIGNRLQYYGGTVPYLGETKCEVYHRLAEQVVTAIPELSGYVGIDMILTDSLPAELVVVEVNPRLTTSYLGYRRLAEENLAARLFGQHVDVGEIHWKSGVCQYLPDGEISMIG